MSDSIITVENLSKSYLVGHEGSRERYQSLRDTLVRHGKNFARKSWDMARGRQIVQGDEVEEFWALKDVSFDVQQGEVLGIIGRNGAGKSTLLKVLSRITEPTKGRVTLHGRVASLLEVGTGFHPELTGRENIFLNGAILGMSKREIRAKFDEIVDFAGVEKFLDTPVKRYSSGMYVRLAFAVAAHLEPEILVVDEVLAVGDAEFQKKCMGKMKDVAGQGRTVLFVSHNMAAVKNLCSRALLLNNGKVSLDSNCETVVATHLGMEDELSLEQEWKDSKLAPGNQETWLRRVAIETDHFHPELGLTTGSKLKVVTEYWNSTPGAKINTSLVLYTADDICVFNTWSSSFARPQGISRDVCTIPEHLLNDDRYRIRILIVRDESIPLIDVDHILNFSLKEEERNGAWFGKVIGVIRPSLEWNSSEVALSKTEAH